MREVHGYDGDGRQQVLDQRFLIATQVGKRK